ncbi:MAG: UDP-N-acetylmuramoyl-L-alanyl-D-glutamate--2,6-diaminopimelate ligase [Acidimicrobiia bacterium]|nr:UDP-N-acetylmuramoyl-L-alanyl-D-glutamate--2,6-diaminopimelate ligase [Acidimicrobiia bacterium]
MIRSVGAHNAGKTSAATARSVILGDLAAAVGGSAECRGEATITGLAHDSRAVERGDLFFCVPGIIHDGHDFASAALKRGAAALVVERPLLLACPQLVTASVRAAMGPISAAYFGYPSQAMQVIGVTGTNGKTTVCSLLGSLLTTSGMPVKVMGTLSGTLTTPEAIDLQHQMAAWRSSGVEVVVMEVSSHALHQHRVDAISYDLAVFTNLSMDHLDYHGTLERYFIAKARLFTPELAQQALVNVADRFGQRLAADPEIPTTGFDPSAIKMQTSVQGLTMQWRKHELSLNLMGRFNAVNALAAAEAALLLGIEAQQVVTGLESAVPVPGRCEQIPTQLPFTVLVDYAHTPDALMQVLESARELLDGDGKLRVVFGCGGERDPSKRPEMGQVASRLCEQVVVTSDNPRGENPESIIAEIIAGAKSSIASIDAVTDRRTAIMDCLRAAGEGDVVVIAGKGHETTQTIGIDVIGFDDRVVTREALDALEVQR